MRDAILFDIDGTMANLDHRLHFVSGNKRDWDSFFNPSFVMQDLPYKHVFELLNVYAHSEFSDHHILLVSARPEKLRDVTRAWFLTHSGWETMPHLYMRADEDYREDKIVKRELLVKIREDGWNPVIAVDDRQKVIDMWQAEGLTVFKHIAPNTLPEMAEVTESPDGDPLLNILVGPSRAGKSLWLKKYVNQQFVVSSDVLRGALTGSFLDQTKNNEVFQLLHDIVKTRVNAGVATWVDATNIRNRDRKAIVQLVPPNVKVRYLVFDRSLEDKLASAGDIPPAVIKRHHNTMRSNLKDILAGDNFPNVTVEDHRA